MDALDREAKKRGVDRATIIAYYQRQIERTGQNGTGGATAPAPAKPKPPQQKQSAYQRIMSALSGK